MISGTGHLHSTSVVLAILIVSPPPVYKNMFSSGELCFMIVIKCNPVCAAGPPLPAGSDCPLASSREAPMLVSMGGGRIGEGMGQRAAWGG